MAGTITPPFMWSYVDGHKVAKNWTQDADGTHREMGTKAAAVAELSQAVNHLLARCPHVVFSKIQQWGDIGEGTKSPLYSWVYPDRVDNGRTYKMHIISAPLVAAAAVNYYAERTGTIQGESTSWHDANVASVNTCFDHYYDVVESAERGSITDADATDGLTIYNGYPVYDVAVQYDPISVLKDGTHTYSNPMLARKTKPVLADAIENVRARFHEVRQTQLPVAFSWTATDYNSSSEPPGGVAGIAVDSATPVNLFDQTVTSRNAITPGASFSAYCCGVGPETQDYGKRVPITVRVAARSDANANITFVGPGHIAGNEVNIQITGGAAAQWYGDDSWYVYGNPLDDDTWTNVDRNKIDFLCAGVASGNVFVYGLQGWKLYEPF